MRVLTFQPQFHPLIRSGQKTSTIRDKARCKPGDELSLRRWIGKPYKPPGQELLIPNQVCTAITQVRMEISKRGNFEFYLCGEEEEPFDDLMVSGNNVSGHAREIARREGFSSWEAMRDWFISAKKIRLGNPYRGAQIEWKYLPLPA